ncbi:MAG: hypothetical protein CMD90_00020 [Gammaproteobacteria bacterium]|nr:hypothetical protein [Gammaproteobacteria bacterium]|tara:strand:- start:949 stop:1728 length:780 start_codon:yes stop_codon:yes gene_type:complete
MASLLKMDIKDLFSKKKKDPGGVSNKEKDSSSLDSAVIKRIIIGLVLVALVVGTYFFLLKPNLNQQEKQIAQVKNWEQQILNCEAEIENLLKNIEILKNERDLKGILFVSDDEFENFYAEITEATIKNGLRIVNITRGDEIPVRLTNEQQTNSSYNYSPVSTSIPCEEGSQYAGMVSDTSVSQQSDPDCQGENCGPIAYYKMSVSYEIEGGFSNYVNFRNVLANKPKIVNIESESIRKNENSNGLIVAKATVSLVKNRD